MSEFMALKEEITLPELQPWLERRLQDYGKLKLRQNSDVTVVFVSGMKSKVNAVLCDS